MKGIEEANVFGDSRLLIQALSGASQSRILRLTRIIKGIKAFSKSFRRLEFFHVLRELNDGADKAANKSMDLNKNELSVNLRLSSALPP